MKNNETQNMMQEFAQNPARGFEMLYKAYSGPLFRYLRSSFNLSREEAEDIMQNVFLPWVTTPEKFTKVEHPASYLFTSARNAALKSRGANREQPLDEDRAEIAGESLATRVETGLAIDEALAKLPLEQKEAVVLKLWIGMTFEEIAEVQQCTLQTVASRYRYAIARLKELIPWQR